MAIYRTDTAINEIAGGNSIAFVFKIDTAGYCHWVRTYSGTIGSGLSDVCIVGDHKIAAVGGYLGEVRVGSSGFITPAGENFNAYFTVLDTAGYLHELQQLHGSGSDGGYAISSDQIGNLYFGGQAGVNIYAGSLTPYTSVGGNTDFFVMRYGVDCDCVSMPVASYTDTGTLIRGFTYTGTTTGIDSVRWDFGDGGTSTLLNPIHTYTTADTFSACVRVYTSCGSDLYCSDIEIPCIAPPVASYVMSGTGLTRNFTYTGTPAGIDSVTWSFSDGGTDVGSTVSHSFASAATYTVCVTAHTPCGTHTSCSSVGITCTSSPVSAFTVSTGAGLTKSFAYTGTMAGIDSVTWDFGDGNTGTGLTPTNTYTAAGTYTVCATVYTNCGTHTACTTIGVTCVTPPAASFTLSGSDLSRNFTYTGTTAGMDSVRWDFGDGSTTTIVNPLHAFAAAGTYTVCVTVYTNCGSDTYCNPVTVTCATLPTASFTYSGTGDTRSFLYTGTTTGMDSVRWYFGDGGTATIVAPSHTYTAESIYNVCVYVFTNCGSDTFCQSVNVNCFLPITAAFTDTGALVHGFSYTGTLSGYDSVVWDFGDGVTDTGLHAIHTYAIADTYHVCATVYTECGTDMLCMDVIINYPTDVPGISLQQVQVFPNPVTQELHVSGLRYKTGYTIYNVVGVKLEKGHLQPGAAIIQTAALPPGVYLIELSAKSGYRKTLQFIKR